MDRPDWNAPLSMYCNGLLCPKNTKPSALSLQAACHTKSPVYSKEPAAASLTTDTVRESPNPVTIYSKAPNPATEYTTTKYTEVYRSTVKEKLYRSEIYANQIIQTINNNNNLTKVYTTDSVYNLTWTQSNTIDNIKKNTNKTVNDYQKLDMEQYVYICMVVVSKKNTSTTPVILSNHCIIPMDKFKQFSNHLRTLLFFQDNCFHWDISRKDVIKFAFYHNVDENTCLSVPTDGIPVGVKTGQTEALCYIPVDVKGKGMFTIDSHVFASACSSEININQLIMRGFHIYPFPKYQKVYTSFNAKANLFNIRTCRIVYGNSTEDLQIPPIEVRHSCLAFMTTGQVPDLMSKNLMSRRCHVDKSPSNEKYFPMVPEQMCATVIQRSVCLVG